MSHYDSCREADRQVRAQEDKAARDVESVVAKTKHEQMVVDLSDEYHEALKSENLVGWFGILAARILTARRDAAEASTESGPGSPEWIRGLVVDKVENVQRLTQELRLLLEREPGPRGR